jgi:hypothetical protein
MVLRVNGIVGVVLLSVLGLREVHAGSHLWRINEVFSNADGTVQFVELHEIMGADQEWFLTHCPLESIAMDKIFAFPENLTEPTGNKYLLLATTAFTACPGAPTPDYIIPDGFFSAAGDTLWYGPAQNYDNFVFQAGDLPVDGVNSIQLVEYAPNTSTLDVFTTAVNSPTNFNGDTGSIDLNNLDFMFVRGDCNDDTAIDLSDAVFLLGSIFLGLPAPPCQDGCDANDDGVQDLSDAVSILRSVFSDSGPLPLPDTCGEDPTPDPLGCQSFSGC